LKIQPFGFECTSLFSLSHIAISEEFGTTCAREMCVLDILLRHFHSQTNENIVMLQKIELEVRLNSFISKRRG